MKEFFSALTWVDYVTFAALLRGAYVGYRSGFFPELLRIVNYVACLLAAIMFSGILGEYLTLKTFLNGTTAYAISFAAILIGVFVVGKIFRMLMMKLVKAGEGGLLNRVTGMLAAMVRWTVLLSFLFFVIEKSPLDQLKSDVHVKSYAGESISKIAPLMIDYLSKASGQFILTKEMAAPTVSDKKA